MLDHHRLSLPVRLALATLLILTLAAGISLAARDTEPAVDTQNAPTQAHTPLPYPETRRVEHVDVYHGVEVRDPYRWLENLESPETHAWMTAQDQLTREHLQSSPVRAELEERLGELMDLPSYGTPIRRGGRFFYAFTEGAWSDQVLLVQQGPQGEPQKIVDPKTASEEHSLAGFAPSPDGRRLAYGLSTANSRRTQWRVRDVATGGDLPETLDGLVRGWSSLAWSADGKGFYYGRFASDSEARDAALGNQSLYYHRLGTPQAEDLAILEPPEDGEGPADWTYTPTVSDDGRHLIVSIRRGSAAANQIWWRDLTAAERTDVDRPFTDLFAGAEAGYRFLGQAASRLFFWTDHRAARGRIVAIDVGQAERPMSEIVAEAEDTLLGANLVADRFVARYSRDALTAVKVFDLAGRFERDVELPNLAWLGGFSGRRGDRDAYYRLSGLTDPGTVYRLDPASGRSTVFRRGELGFDPEAFVTRQVFYTSRDGTRVPMFVAHRRGLEQGTAHPVMLYAYGAFGWPATPWFQPEVLAWMERGGLYALANVRGGGEYGKAWQQAGVGVGKRNVIDDFIAAGEWLIAEGYTSPQKLSIRGGSASGPLVGAALVLRPELFAAALVNIPALDMLRFSQFTSGARWIAEFGSPDEPETFAALRSYSPYHNLAAGTCYPATLVTAGERDDVIVPSHAYKFTAALQTVQSCDRPALLQIAWGAGHSLGKSREDGVASRARQLAFLFAALGIDEKASPPST